jgi:hypothetical protein
MASNRTISDSGFVYRLTSYAGRAGLLCAGLALSLLRPVQADPTSPVASAAPHPVIEVRELSKDGGTVEEGTTLHFQFTVANRGKTDLELKDVKPSCGCTVPHWDKVVKPGKEGIIEAEVRTVNFRGAIAKHLTVISNDPEHPQLDLTLTAKVTPLIQITPGTVALLSLEDNTATQEFRLERTGNRPMKIVQVVATQPYLKTSLTALPGGSAYRIAITATADTPLGRTTAPVVVRTDVPKAENQTLVLILDRGIVAQPSMVFWSVPPGQLASPLQNVVTISRRGGKFHVTGATVDDPKVTAKLETAREGLEYRVSVTYAGGWDAGMVQKTLTLTTDDPKQPIIKVPVQALIQKLPAVRPAAPAAATH